MNHYIFDPEEKEYVEIVYPKGRRPLSLAEIFKRRHEDISRQQREAGEKEAGKQE